MTEAVPGATTSSRTPEPSEPTSPVGASSPGGPTGDAPSFQAAEPRVGSASPRRLTRSRRDRMVAGVCGGLGRHLDVDPVLLRIAAVALTLTTGFGLIAYVVAWIVVPEAEEDEPERAARMSDQRTVAIAVGAALVGLGGLLLLREWLPGFGAGVFWSLVVMAAGAVVLVSARR